MRKLNEIHTTYDIHEKALNLYLEFNQLRRSEIDRLQSEIDACVKERGEERAEVYKKDREEQIATIDEMYLYLQKWVNRYCFKRR